MFLLVVTVSSMLLAAIMSVIAWRIAAEDRRRSDARVAALAAEIHAQPAEAAIAPAQARSAAQRADVGVRGEPARVASFPAVRQAPRWDDLPLRTGARAPVQSAPLFAHAQPRSIAPAVAVAVLVILAGMAGAVAFLMPPRDPVAAASAASAPAAPTASAGAVRDASPPTTASALELVALGHVRDGDRLTVRGLVRAPARSAAPERLAAVVFVFNADGGFVTSARAAIDTAVLRRDGEAPFVVNVPDASAVSRYRVSFRSDDRIVPHVDRRDTQAGER